MKAIEIAYCVECEKDVEIFWEVECDEVGREYDVPTCSECLCSIKHCFDCDLWHPDNKDTPLGETYGTCMKLRCPPNKRRVHAFDLICKSFVEARS